MSKNPSLKVAADDAGKIKVSYKGKRKEIPAVIFTESEIEKLFEGINFTVTTAKNNIKSKSNKFKLFFDIISVLSRKNAIFKK